MEFNEEVLIKHSDWQAAAQIIQRLQSHGFQAVLAGGCVRDGFLNRIPKDIDIATSAEPETVEKLFSKSVSVGKAFGVIRVLDFGSDIEVASFRHDGAYVDGRRPVEVTWASDKEDALRRDFTINALFYDPINKKISDFVGGLSDLKAKLIKCVGEASARFKEDHLRLVRALRFAAELDFKIEESTWKAVVEYSGLVVDVSHERVRDETLKLLKAPMAKVGFNLLFESGLLSHLDPDLNSIWSVDSKQRRWLSNQSSENVIWSYFFSWTSSNRLKSRLELYKLSRETQKFVKTTLQYFWDQDRVQAMSLGQKLVAAQNPEFRLALNMLEENGQISWIEDLKAQIRSRNLESGYPDPLLTGLDLPSDVAAELRGSWLKKAYELQLELSLTSKSNLLNILMERSGEKIK